MTEPDLSLMKKQEIIDTLHHVLLQLTKLNGRQDQIEARLTEIEDRLRLSTSGRTGTA